MLDDADQVLTRLATELEEVHDTGRLSAARTAPGGEVPRLRGLCCVHAALEAVLRRVGVEG